MLLSPAFHTEQHELIDFELIIGFLECQRHASQADCRHDVLSRFNYVGRNTKDPLIE